LEGKKEIEIELQERIDRNGRVREEPRSSVEYMFHKMVLFINFNYSHLSR
jgi:hypothetical protein